MWSHHLLGAAASKLAGRPVRVTLSREGVYRLVGGRTNTEQRVAIGADDDGRFTALIHTGISAMTAHNALAEQFTFPARHMYATETLKTDQQVVDMDMLANSFMRAPGESVGTFALESAIDELAIELDLDPIELRIRNEPEKDPSSGLPFSSRHLVDAWRAGAERFGWERRAAAGHAPGGRMADRHGLRDRDLSLPPLSRRRRADQARQDGPRDGRGAGQRHGDGDLDDPDDHHRRAARPAAGAGDRRLRRLLVPRQPDRRGLLADGLDRRRGDRRPARARRAAARTRRRRLAPGRADRRRGRRSRRGAVRARRPEPLGELLEDPGTRGP